jgi:hypothetical protein
MALDVSEAIGGEFFDGGVKIVHGSKHNRER